MNCHEARDWFSACVDGALTAGERARLEGHLAECIDCRRELDRFSQTVSLLGGLERQRAPVGFVDRVLAAVRATPWHRRLLERLFLPLRLKLPMEAAAVILVATLAVYVFQRTPELQRATREEAPPQATAPAATEAQRSPTLATPSRERSRVRDSAGPAGGPEPTPRQGAVTREDTEGPASSKPSPPPEPKQESAERPAGASRVLEQSPLPAPAAPQPLLRKRAGSGEERSRGLAAPPPAALEATRGLPSSDVVGRLVITDRETAERGLTDLLMRAGGTLVTRRVESGVTLVEIVVPRSAYGEFAQGLARIGSWQPEQEPALLSPQVHITLRLTN